MGHRKQSAPRHGSLAFLPRARSSRLVARIRYWPIEGHGEPKVLGFAGYKVGMTHASVFDNRDFSNTRGKEIQVPVTVLETPPLKVVAVRVYTATPNGIKSLAEIWVDKIPEQISRRISTLKTAKFVNKVDYLKKIRDKIADVRLVVCTQPWLSGFGKKTPEVFELALSGDLDKRVDFAISLLGRDLPVSEVLKEGQYVDVFAVTKGKGWASTIKRFGVRIMSRKSNKTRRGIATMGAKSPNNVMYTVPRAGQLGFWQRIMRNLLVLKIGSNKDEVNVKGGFLRYGEVRSNYVLLMGSAPGPAKRLVKIRASARMAEKLEDKLRVNSISIESKQGV
ncbi:MAG: 50S ribosomal protein L3 [Thermoproteota archaeon]